MSFRRKHLAKPLSMPRTKDERFSAYRSQCRLDRAERLLRGFAPKRLNFRAASISFEEYDASPAYTVEFYMNAPNVSAVFDWIFPWLEFGYLDMPQDDNGEVMEHVFEVKLNSLGQAFLMLEDYYLNGAEPNPNIDIMEPTGEIWDDEQFAQYQREKAQQEDWEAQAFERWQNEKK
jgi:hypothetical protein